jgi:ABC-type Fe3+ transport system substrate-binding protein
MALGESMVGRKRSLEIWLTLWLLFLGPWVEASAQTGWQAQWAELVAAAKKEGVVVVAASPSPELREELEQAFSKRFGFRLEYFPLNGTDATARVEREAQIGKPSIDVLLYGNTEMFNLYPAGRLDPMRDKLILPEVLDPAKWRYGKLKFNDPEGQYFLQTVEFTAPDLVVNPSIVKPAELASWKNLLKPEFKGRIASFDPRGAGQGQFVATYLLYLFGAEFVKELYIGQGVTYTRDRRQLAEWVGRGTYPVALAVVAREIEELRKLGLVIERVAPKDGPGNVNGGGGVIKLVKNSQHPNAAAIFLNWFLTKEAQEIYQRTNVMPSLRTDVGVAGMPDYVIPKEGAKYVDAYSYAYTVEFLPKARKLLLELLGR